MARAKAKYGFLWVTSALFLFSLAGQWAFAWPEYLAEQEDHGKPVEARDYFYKTARGTLENWQSEFLQLAWQVAGLSFLWYVGSPQSKEGHDRVEKKIDAILKRLDPENAERIKRELAEEYPEK